MDLSRVASSCSVPDVTGRGRRLVVGFTLMELLIAVAVVAILAAVALPGYRKTVLRGQWQSARDILQTVYSGEQVYWTANNKYVDPVGNWRQIYMDDPNVGSAIPVTFGVVTNGLTGAAATFTATGTYTPTGATQTVDEGHIFGGTWAQP